MDYTQFCKSFFEATGIPVNLLFEGKPVYSSLGDMLSIPESNSWEVYPPSRNPEFSSINPDLEYGHVQIEGTGYDVFLGPVLTAPATETLIHEFITETRISPEYRESIAELLYSVPVNSHPQFVRYLMLVHLCLNHKLGRPEDLYAEEKERTVKRTAAALDSAIDSKENEKKRNSLDFENRLYHYIRKGNTAQLKEFLENTKEFPSEGKTAATPLRHAKNSFISFTAKAGMLGAIKGGVDADRVYQLTDMYDMECEQMQTIEQVHRLQYIMLMDLCQRCGAAKVPQDVSPEVFQCMNYIQNHTNGSVSLEDVAGQIHRSTSYLSRKFREELGMSAGDYITKCKMEEASEMLRYSDRTLSEISAYLGYSSQSYFQNVFKKYYGMTPMQHRKQAEIK